MPKLSKRKRQLKEIYQTRRQDEVDGSSDQEKEDDNNTATLNGIINVANSNINNMFISNTKNVSSLELSTSDPSHKKDRKSARNISKLSNSTTSTVTAVDDRAWVQCNYCEKWRSLPPNIDPKSLPEVWYCELNSFDPSRMSCDAPEESYTQTLEEAQHIKLKSFVKLWSKKLKNADRAESRLPPSALTRGRKKKTDAEWIRCCNPSCGKWRSVIRTIETTSLLRRLNKGQFFGTSGCVWYCSMNSWDDSTASCMAPQEPLWNCKWNLNGGIV